MKLINPLQMNNCEIRQLLVIVISLQLSVWGLIGLDHLGLHVPIVRQLFVFVYLTFVPGILLLRVLKLHNLNGTETLLYSVGLSIAVSMFSGLFINIVFPQIGIRDPISLDSLVFTLSVIVLGLCALSYVRDKEYADPAYLEINGPVSRQVLALCLIPFISILGTYCMNNYGINTVLILFIVIICLAIFFIYFYGFIKPELYPIAVFVIALAILYHTSLISPYLWGWDINEEYYLSHLVVAGSVWDQTIKANINGMLSIVMLAPIYSIVGNIDLVWVFKALYTFIFALVPLGLYCVFKKQVNEKVALLSCLLFISYFVFFTEMISLARQEIAELFLVLLIMLMINKTINIRTWACLFIIFNVSLVVSHYAISYMFLFMLLAMCIIIVFIHAIERSFISRAIPLFGHLMGRVRYGFDLFADKQKIVLILINIVVLLGWYSYVSCSSLLTTVLFLILRIYNNIFINFLNPGTAEGYALLISETTTPLHQVYKYIQIVVQVFICISIIMVIIRPKIANFNKNYLLLSMLNLTVCFMGIALPYFSSVLNTSRLYQITLIVLAPFCILGASMFLSLGNMVLRRISTLQIDPLKIVSIFVIIFILFNTGWFFEMVHDKPTSFALNNSVDTAIYNRQEVAGAKWVVDGRNDLSTNNRNPIIADGYRWVLFLGMTFTNINIMQTNRMPHNAYVFLGTYNLETDKVYAFNTRNNLGVTYQYLNSSEIVGGLEVIYDNDESMVYYSQ